MLDIWSSLLTDSQAQELVPASWYVVPGQMGIAVPCVKRQFQVWHRFHTGCWTPGKLGTPRSFFYCCWNRCSIVPVYFLLRWAYISQLARQKAVHSIWKAHLVRMYQTYLINSRNYIVIIEKLGEWRNRKWHTQIVGNIRNEKLRCWHETKEKRTEQGYPVRGEFRTLVSTYTYQEPRYQLMHFRHPTLTYLAGCTTGRHFLDQIGKLLELRNSAEWRGIARNTKTKHP